MPLNEFMDEDDTLTPQPGLHRIVLIVSLSGRVASIADQSRTHECLLEFANDQDVR
jgi:hypothetical protein